MPPECRRRWCRRGDPVAAHLSSSVAATSATARGAIAPRRAADHAGHVAAHLHPGLGAAIGDRAKAPATRRCEQLMFFWLKDLRRHRTPPSPSPAPPGRPRKSLQAGVSTGNRRPADAAASTRRQQLGVVAHLRHPLGRHEGGGLDAFRRRGTEAAHQLELGIGGDELLFVLQAVAGPISTMRTVAGRMRKTYPQGGSWQGAGLALSRPTHGAGRSAIRGLHCSYSDQAVFAPSSPELSFIFWRIWNFWILPVTVIGKLSTKRR